jgi:hypothetical protein
VDLEAALTELAFDYCLVERLRDHPFGWALAPSHTIMISMYPMVMPIAIW